MSTPDDYRAMAEECLRWAREAQTRFVSVSHLRAGINWRHILVLHKSQRRDDRHLVRRQQTEQG
jgi:hypothetical protein